MQRREHKIYPATGWTHNAQTDEWSAVVAGIHATITTTLDSSADGYVAANSERYFLRIDAPTDDADFYEAEHQSLQGCADDAAEQLAAHLMTAADADQLMGVLRYEVLRDESGQMRQTEIAKILGVSQPTVSDWMTGKSPVPGSVRAHLMRIAGLRRTPESPSKWAVY